MTQDMSNKIMTLNITGLRLAVTLLLMMVLGVSAVKADDITEGLYYIASKGKKYKSHYATILTWSRKNDKKNTKDDIIPDWFNEDLSGQKLMTDKDYKKEMEDILKEME